MLCSILPQPNLMHVRLILNWPGADPKVGKNEGFGIDITAVCVINTQSAQTRWLHTL